MRHGPRKENSIKKIEGLQNCLNLQKLYLPFNCIKDLAPEIGSGLAGLEQLEVLWLAGNQLRSLENLVLPSLTELNAASNQLSSVVGAFDQLPQLQSLNLAGNRLCSFKEVLDLSRSSLTALSFADPDFGENPICSLCNYPTYVLYHLPKLQVHDQMYVDAEAHNMAQAAYAQKRLYYNMHIKTLKRQSGDCLRAAKVIHEARCNTLGQDLSAAARLLRRADAFRQSREKNGGDEADPAEYQDLELATRRLQLCEVELADADFAFQQLQQSVQQTLDAHISRLLLELRSGGNVRFEKVDDTSQVAGLVTSRFRPEDFSLFGFNRIKIGQAIPMARRLHHRSLQLRFEQLMDCSDTSASFEYLFYVPQSRHALEELREVAEAGPARIFEQLKHRSFSKTSSSAEELVGVMSGCGLSANANVKDLLTTLRTWRRNLGRATELGVQLPDPLLLVGLLTKWSDLLSRLGGSQMAFRIAGMRQMLALDTTPVSSSVVEFAEHLQAEAEQLMLATPTSASTLSTMTTASSSATTGTKTKDLPSVKAFTAEKGEKTGERPKCRFWGTSVGCKRGDSCRFEHSWEGIQKRGRCWFCSAEGHMKPECPYALQLRYLEAKSVQPETKNGVRVALVDGGATHALRRGTAQELSEAEAVTVELAHGTTVLHKMKG
eukprot:s1287_g14.t1